MALIDRALAHHGGGNGNAGGLLQLRELGVGAGEMHAAAGDDQGIFGLREQQRRLRDFFRIGERAIERVTAEIVVARR